MLNCIFDYKGEGMTKDGTERSVIMVMTQVMKAEGLEKACKM